jgi:hypothetical protein
LTENAQVADLRSARSDFVDQERETPFRLAIIQTGVCRFLLLSRRWYQRIRLE